VPRNNNANQKKLRYLMVGIVNTVIGYFIGVGIYKALGENLGIFWIGIISNIFSITISFLSYKILVFRTKGMWLVEYMRAYAVYGGSALIGIIFLWLFVDKLKLSIWLAQALVITVTVIISYLGHSRFTFRHRET
jgi:putative flippase GtrA